VASASVAVAQAPLPDLVVTSITPPPSGALSGTSVPVTFTVKNQGTAPTEVPVWNDWVALSQDPTIGQSYVGDPCPVCDGGDRNLNNQPVILGFQNPSFLDVGQSYTQAVDLPLPLSAQGTWYVYVIPDGTGFHHPFAMTEASRTDKLALNSGFTVNLSPTPDLAVTAVQAPAQSFSGQPLTLSWTVANQGTGPTAVSDWTDAVYMSSKATLDSSATLLGTFPHGGVLARGASYTAADTVTLPVGVSGPFYFFVDTDVYGQVFEDGATANNLGATATAETVNLTPPPDLTVTAVSGPTSAQASHPFSFTYHVDNDGAGATPNTSWTDSFYLSPTAGFDPHTAVLIGQQRHNGALAAGAGYDASVTATVPDGLSGTAYLLVDSDSGNLVFELNKNNNVNTPTGTIPVTSKPADLAVTTAAAPGAAAAGSAVLVTWKVVNQGTGDTVASTWVDNVYADTGSSPGANAVLLGSFTHNGLLNAGDSYTQAQLVTLPISLSGAYHLFVVTNVPPNGQQNPPVYEAGNISNDTSAALPVTITQHLADLQVTSVTAPAAPRAAAPPPSAGPCRTPAPAPPTPTTGTTTSGCPPTTRSAAAAPTSTSVRCSTPTRWPPAPATMPRSPSPCRRTWPRATTTSSWPPTARWRRRTTATTRASTSSTRATRRTT
jgi:hypothetical protein